MKPPDIYKTIYIVFAISVGAYWVGWMPSTLFGAVSLVALGAFIHEWRSNIARSNAEKAEEASMIASHAPELQGMENDFVAQASHALKAMDAFKATASHEAAALFGAKFKEEVQSWKDSHDGKDPGPWLSVAVLRRVEAALRAAMPK